VVHDDETGRKIETVLDANLAQQALLIAPAERADVIVDFTSLPAGTRVRMINTAPDPPYGGFPVDVADAGTTGQVMEFRVGTAAGPLFTLPTKLKLVDMEPLVPDVPLPRVLTLNEEESSQVCIDEATGAFATCGTDGAIFFAPKAAKLGTMDANMTPLPLMWMDPVTENPQPGSTEEWEIHNTTADAHPIHLHQVHFQVLNREDAASAVVDLAKPWENGWKDTVIAYPGQITRIRAKFNHPGVYVWHCHILEHEDNEMMRPACVGDPTDPEVCPGLSAAM
jgi:FtsP/CotA-like multicopper oxidase with cupredoxin domain